MPEPLRNGPTLRDVLQISVLLLTIGSLVGVMKSQIGRLEAKVDRIETKIESLPVHDAYFRSTDQRLRELAARIDRLEGLHK